MAKKNDDFQITVDLQETVRANPNIKEVYFAENGDHFFVKHEIEVHDIDDDGISAGTRKVECLPGAKLGLVKVPVKINKQTVMKDKFVNTDWTEIAMTVSREDILKARAVGKNRSTKEQLEILQAAAEIAKGQNLQELLDKLKEQNA